MIIDLNLVAVFLAVAEEGGEIVGHPQAAFASVATTLIERMSIAPVTPS
jgi:hypothetical protein